MYTHMYIELAMDCSSMGVGNKAGCNSVVVWGGVGVWGGCGCVPWLLTHPYPAHGCDYVHLACWPTDLQTPNELRWGRKREREGGKEGMVEGRERMEVRGERGGKRNTRYL